ncbi:MAG: MFS transporter, partial [Candidatus Lokiarchaeota archaeon]|nr:MFS transporter [Candidatus Lokiarchaeota archaeon]
MQSEKNWERYTYDFKPMIQIVILNSLGFFFLEFIIQYFASQQLNATGTQMGLIFSVHVIGQLISSFFTGIIADRIKSKTKLILLGSFGRGFAYFVFYTAIVLNSLIGLGIGGFTLGFFVGFFWIPFNTLIAEKSNKDHRSQAYGKRDSAIGKGLLIGSIIGFIIFSWGFQTTDNAFIIYSPILMFGIANFIAGILFILKVDESIKFMDNPIESNNSITKEISTAVFSKPLLIGSVFLLVVLLLSNVNGSLAKPFLNIYLLEVIESDPTIVIWVYMPSGIISMLIAPKLGEALDKIHPLIGITVSSVIGSIITWFLINTTNLWIFAILLIFDITIVGTASLVLINLLSRITLKHRGKIMG